MDGIINTIVTDVEEIIKKYNLACSVEVRSFCVSSSADGTKIIIALSKNGDIIQKWVCICENDTWSSSCIANTNFVKSYICNETNCLDCYLCELTDIEECHGKNYK